MSNNKLLLAICIYLLCHFHANAIKVGILIPAVHPSLTKIVQGFTSPLKKDENVSITLFQANGDLMMERNYIQQMIRQSYDYIIPIGTQTSIHLLGVLKRANKSIKVISLASKINTINSFATAAKVPVTGVQDELSACAIFKKLTPYFSQHKKMTLIYSPSEKILDEVKELELYFKKSRIKIQKIMVQTSKDVAMSINAIHKDSDFIFILKDHFVVMNTPLLAKIAKLRKIPIISSDEGSLKLGANFSIGVRETEIGKKGSELFFKSYLKKIPLSKISPIYLGEN